MPSIEHLTRSNEENRRFARENIETAMLQLLRDHDPADISISDIIRRSGTSRNSFYRNYGTK
ncbi:MULTISPECIES: hypothetical protein [unclassified Corynebacterium]|uniref:TetR/AcrR family transcriptional regulator n=1 Tax=unclassified Corynebacterium TaxID=2624378 RepID=UPI0029CA805D|nr:MULTISPECIES: hypothetical protein [unclassified Corynebacterium]WPF66122.1 TetR family transcriptional regulator [Corynebacterium sp. 22KM0430]WPF68614.1 TetR family transcriptional regulator [Corynebacterium sp. 21KM1197]